MMVLRSERRLCLLALAASLREANFDVVMIDAAIEPDYLTRIECESVDALCIGISVLTGPMIRGAIEVATAVKTYTPWLPVIFGGWHPSLLPDETLNETFVDMVVRGQGEITIVEVAQAISLTKHRSTTLPDFRGKTTVAASITSIAK